MNNTETLKKEILQAHQAGDIAKLYTFEQSASESFNEETLHGFYANILDLALEKLTDTLEAHRKMDMTEVQDFATLRALYEYAIEHYSAGDATSASALFEVLAGLSNDEKFSQALLLHKIAADEALPFEDFLEKIADLEATQNAQTFYISHFTPKAQQLLENVKKGEDK